jgi:hypothetical protein
MANAEAFESGWDAGSGGFKKMGKKKPKDSNGKQSEVGMMPKGSVGIPGGSSDTAKTGGKVKKTGWIKLHKNEIVVPAREAKTLKRVVSGKKAAKRKTSRKRVSK